MAHSRLFGARDAPPGNHVVFLDGRAGSFALSIGADKDLIFDPQPVSWAWSSYLRHSLIITGTASQIFLRSWERPSEAHKLAMPRSASDAEALLQRLLLVRRPRSGDVVAKMIAAFKDLRSSLSSYHADNLPVIRVFNLLITLADANGVQSLLQHEVIGDLLDHGPAMQYDDLRPYRDASVDRAAQLIASASPRGLLPVDPHLLIRHASGHLYQEAHFELERQAYIQPLLFGGREPNVATRGHRQRDARLTPPELARTLIEQSLRQFGELPHRLESLDPACGSGVFLQELLRELEAVNYRGHVRLAGFDLSPVSVEISNFCLDRAVRDANAGGLAAEHGIEIRNALHDDWGTPQLILMNPPFVSYKDMAQDDRAACKDILGNLAIGHFDKAMAFIWKAVRALSPGGVVASVLPGPLLDGSNGERWRKALLEHGDICAVGRFGGYSYFQGAMVEPAFIVLKKHGGHQGRVGPMAVVIAEEAAEDAAMRALRKGQAVEAEDGSTLVSFENDGPRRAGNWMPRNYKRRELLARLVDTPCVRDLFRVRQGVIAGNNDVFILRSEEFQSLPPEEREFFGPAAGTATIRNGQLLEQEYVFYPYDTNGLRLTTEEQLKQTIPRYYAGWLKPAKPILMLRRSKDESNWWTLTEYRAWQPRFRPKIVTAYFGASGKFAYDDTGRFVCVHGYAWSWRVDYPLAADDAGDEPPLLLRFYQTEVPWSYVAILNSLPFSALLSCFCTRVQGGQFNLSIRYVNNVPIPDLLSGYFPEDLAASLASIGRRLSRGEGIDHSVLTPLVSKAYGVPVEQWGLDR